MRIIEYLHTLIEGYKEVFRYFTDIHFDIACLKWSDEVYRLLFYKVKGIVVLRFRNVTAGGIYGENTKRRK